MSRGELIAYAPAEGPTEEHHPIWGPSALEESSEGGLGVVVRSRFGRKEVGAMAVAAVVIEEHGELSLGELLREPESPGQVPAVAVTQEKVSSRPLLWCRGDVEPVHGDALRAREVELFGVELEVIWRGAMSPRWEEINLDSKTMRPTTTVSSTRTGPMTTAEIRLRWRRSGCIVGRVTVSRERGVGQTSSRSGLHKVLLKASRCAARPEIAMAPQAMLKVMNQDNDAADAATAAPAARAVWLRKGGGIKSIQGGQTSRSR